MSQKKPTSRRKGTKKPSAVERFKAEAPSNVSAALEQIVARSCAFETLDALMGMTDEADAAIDRVVDHIGGLIMNDAAIGDLLKAGPDAAQADPWLNRNAGYVIGLAVGRRLWGVR